VSGPSRRRFIGGGVALAVGCGGTKGGDTGDSAGPAVPMSRAPEPTAPWGGRGADDGAAFPIGVQAGEPRPDGAVLWTRYQGGDALSVVLASWDGAAWSELSSADVAVGPDGFVHHSVDALSADTPIAYQFEDAAGARSPVGHARTATPPEHTGAVRIAATSCTDQDHGEFPCLDQVQGVGPIDLFLWLGDMVYQDGRFTVEEYREGWAENLTKTSFRALLSGVASVHTWDDHEVGNNWDPQTIDPAQRDAAYQAFFETIPYIPSAPQRLWRSLRYGPVELFVLDCRGERDAAAGHYISPDQLQWLMDGLSASDAVWKVVANSVPISDMPIAWDALEAGLDRWEGFPNSTQREVLLDHITDGGIRGVLFVAGDLHQTTLCRVEAEGPRSRILETMAGPGGSFPNVAARLFGEDGVQWLYNDAEWSATWMEFRADGTASLICVDELGQRLFEATIDVAGGAEIHSFIHPWQSE
jgi:alkaline phosphatase D